MVPYLFPQFMKEKDHTANLKAYLLESAKLISHHSCSSVIFFQLRLGHLACAIPTYSLSSNSKFVKIVI